MRISHGAQEMNVSVEEETKALWKVKDIFTTVDGFWYLSGSPYSIPEWAIDDYYVPGTVELGGANHIYVAALDEEGNYVVPQTVVFSRKDEINTRFSEEKNGFANLPVSNAFFPDQNLDGGWKHGLPGGTWVHGGGLPYGQHVSLFVVWEPNDDDIVEPEENVVQVLLDNDDTIVEIYQNGHPLQIKMIP